MASDKQILANRENALVSTGPKTEAGKAMASRNATKHGIFARELIITRGDGKEEGAEYNRLLSELVADFAPQGRMEMLLVEKIAVNYWRLRRLIRYETGEVREMLDNLKMNAVRRAYEQQDDDERPSMEYYDYSDNISEGARDRQLRRVCLVGSKTFDPTKDEEALEFVVSNRLNPDAEEIMPADLRRAKKYVTSLSPQQKGKLRRQIADQAEQILAEMDEVRRWQEKFDRLSRTKAIPSQPDLDKVIKYENSLERSILRNLAALKALQGKRILRPPDAAIPGQDS